MSEPTDNGGPAFPVPSICNANGDVQYGVDGMSLRDWLAGQALNGILSQPPSTLMASYRSLWEPAVKESDSMSEFCTKLVRFGYCIADAAITERKKLS